jgi:DNA repair exonuclease SbcCD ATPase subunit
MPADLGKDPDPYLDLVDETAEDLGEEVQKTNTELEKLKRQLEDIEKQKLRLEELRRRQDELEDGRSEMIDKFTRSLVVVQREAEETQKRLEQLHAIHNSFTQHLRYIESINAKSWSTNELQKELSRALSAVEDARADFLKAQAKIAADAPAESVAAATMASYDQEYAGDEDRGFLYWLKSGFAFTLPLQILGLLLLVVWWMALFSGK